MAKKKTSHTVYEGSTSDLKFDDKNFNKHTKKGMELLSRSIERNGFGRSVLVDKNNRLVAGNGITEQALKQGKMKTVVVETDGDELVVVKRKDLDLDSKKGRDMALADNTTSAVDLDLDEDMLRQVEEEFEDFDVSDWGIDLQDFDEEPGDDGAASSQSQSGVDASASNAKEDDYTPVSFELIPDVVSRGDIWELGNHRLICGDPCDFDTWRMLMGEAQGSMMYVDTMPLGVLMSDYIDDVICEASSAIKSGAGVYAWYDFKELGTVMNAVKSAGLSVSQELVWVKDKAVDTKPDYKLRHESCVYGWKGKSHQWHGGTTPDSVLEFASSEQIEGVPDMKPVRLIAYLMQCSTKPGEIITDPFGQLGATLIAAEQMGRKAYICEVNPMKCNAIIDRYIKFTNKSDLVYQVNGTDLIRYSDLV